MKLEVNNVEYKNFEQASATLRLDSLSNTFSFSAVSTTGNPLPFTGGEPCKVIVDGEIVVSGFIEVVSGTYGSRSHAITVQGRDKTGDLIDSSLDKLNDIRAPVTLKAIIEKVVKNIGLEISVIDNAGSAAFNKAETIAAPEPGDNAFDFIENLARHRQVLLTSDKNGNIVIEKTPGARSTVSLQNIPSSDDNNVISASFSYDDTGRYNVYKFLSSLNPVALNNAGTTKTEVIVNQKGAVIDTGIRAGRQLVFVSGLSFSNNQNEARAKWEANVRRARGRVYSCVVRGFRQKLGGDLWLPNTIVQVVDDFAGINSEMLINSTTYNFDVTNGRTTTITLVEKNAYTLILTEPKTKGLGIGLT